ncbi:ATP-dependent DNA helicase [Corynebacterium sp. H128]|uniref:ATP-dependent DNA helicase n=1 Tax=unclassified Corynebacterium TaxID=2624378 RepID=UPI00309C6A13
MTDFVPSARFAPPEKLEVKLVPAPEATAASRTWSEPARGLLTAAQTEKPGRWRVTGTAGSGVTSLVIDTVLARIKAGVDPARILVLATSKESGAILRRELALELPRIGYASEAPLVRSVHSFAFALVRSARLGTAEGQEDAALGRSPRLITGAQQDVLIQELLQIQAEQAESYWPENVRDALLMVGFARQLRDFLLRAQERGLGPSDLQSLGAIHNRPMWVAAGAFLQEYEQLTQLSGAQLYNASELVAAALAHLEADQEFLLEQQSRIESIIVDDAQNLDPESAKLVEKFSASARFSLLAGNPEHAVFHFRGASPASLQQWEIDHEIRLSRRFYVPTTSIRYAETPATELAVIANRLRRAHLIDGVPWRDMAVVVRTSGAVAGLRRALLAAGVPVTLQPTDVVLAEQRLVSSLLLALKAVSDELTQSELEELVLGPIGGADSVTLRRLLRGLRQAEMKRGGIRRASDVLRAALTTSEPMPEEFRSFLTDREQEIFDRLHRVLTAGIAATKQGASVELVLWEVWDATELSDRLMNASLRGGAAGSQADLDLNAVMALFDAAGDFVERTPAASLNRFVSHIAEQELPTGARDRRGFAPEAVALLTAHATIGRNWPIVVVANVQEGSWPALAETGSLFGQEDLIELHDRGIDPNLITSRTAEKVSEERRLFRMACSRATAQLLVTAVISPDSDEVDEPSRFLEELGEELDVQVGFDGAPELVPGDATATKDTSAFPRVLSRSSVIAELRRVLESADAAAGLKAEAARQLARLAKAGLYGAHPDHWWGLAAPSETETVLKIQDHVRISPSKIETALLCPLRAALSSYGEDDDSPIYLFKGILLHAGAEAAACGVSRTEIEQILDEAYAANTEFPSWKQDAETADWHRVVTRTLDWVEGRSLLGAEVTVNVPVAQLDDGTPVHIAGRMDRLERNSAEEFLVVDLKTGKTSVSGEEVKTHPQLFAYQLALACGSWNEGQVTTSGQQPDPSRLGGGLLVYPASPTVKVKEMMQDPKSAEQLAEFARLLPDVVVSLIGPEFLATQNKHCDLCTLKSMCPARAEGQALTNV